MTPEPQSADIRYSFRDCYNLLINRVTKVQMKPQTINNPSELLSINIVRRVTYLSNCYIVGRGHRYQSSVQFVNWVESARRQRKSNKYIYIHFLNSWRYAFYGESKHYWIVQNIGPGSLFSTSKSWQNSERADAVVVTRCVRYVQKSRDELGLQSTHSWRAWRMTQRKLLHWNYRKCKCESRLNCMKGGLWR